MRQPVKWRVVETCREYLLIRPYDMHPPVTINANLNLQGAE